MRLDYNPIMDAKAFTQAINLGIGRVHLWLREHPWQPYADAIRHVCLHNTAYDPQCEGSRAQYVYDIIQLTDAPEQFAEVAIKGLLASKDYWDTCHLYRLARLFAQGGNAAAREAIYAKFSQDDAEEHFLGASQIFRLDGMAGLLFVLERIGQWTLKDPDYWIDDGLLNEAKRVLGDNVAAEVTQAAQTNPDIGRYIAAQEQWKRESKDPRPPTDDPEHVTYAEVRQRIIEKPSEISRYWLWRWGKLASEESLRQAAADVLPETDPERLVAYLRIFDQREFPLDPQRLIELATAESEEVATAARMALRNIRHDSVRALSMDLFGQGKADGDVIRLLVLNYAAGDERMIESLLTTQTDEDALHWSCYAAVKVFDANVNADPMPSLLQVYERCRCSNCREGAVKVLMARRVMPGWMREECRCDSKEDIRKMIAEAPRDG